MKRALFCLPLLLIGIFQGCGVHVGNGMKTFESSFGFKVDYPEQLKLKETEGGRLITIDNSPLLKEGTDNELLSYVELRVEEDRGVKTTEDLKNLARKEQPEADFRALNRPGATGLASQTKQQGTTLASHYWLTQKGVLVRSNTVAFENNRGEELLLPIAESFSGK